MADDVDAAEAHLSKGSSPFHKVRFYAGTVRQDSVNERWAYTSVARKGSRDIHAGDTRVRARDHA
jgi:hypothetical protein